MSNNLSHQTLAKRRTYPLTGWIIGIACVLLIGYLVRYISVFDTDTYTDDAQVQQLLTPINARVGGYINEVRFKDFQPVRKGDTLVVIDNTDYLLQRELAEAALLDAQAGRKVTTSSINTVENQVAVAGTRIDEAKAKLWNAEKNYNRYKTLLEKESVTAQQFDQVKSDYEVLKAQIDALEKSKTSSRLTVNETSQKVAINEAAIKRARAQLEVAALNVRYTVILAPSNGFVGRKTIVAGQLIQAGQQLTNVVENDNKWVTANFKEKQLASIKQGQRVRITIDALPDQTVWGTVQAFSSATGSVYSLVPVDNATGNFVKIQQRIPVRIEFGADTAPAFMDQLKAGMSALVYIQ